jgi:DNA-binding NtrC family response regulator
MAKILVIDDEAHILRILQVNLERVGHEVVTVQHPRIATQQVSQTCPELSGCGE